MMALVFFEAVLDHMTQTRQGPPSPTGQAMPTRRKKKTPQLEELSPGEARSALLALVAAHPELRQEAETLAGNVLAAISYEQVAGELAFDLEAMPIEDLFLRAEPDELGYTDPGEAAYEILHETLMPFLESVKRHASMGLDAVALEGCKGILLGLYNTDQGEGGQLFNWAPDAPSDFSETPIEAFEEVVGEGLRLRRMQSAIQAFAREKLPKWKWLHG